MSKNKLKRDYFFFEIVMAAAIVLLMASIFYPYTLFIRTRSRTAAIEKQLISFGMDSRAYMRDIGLRRMRYKSLLEKNVHKPLTSYWGESYDGLIFNVEGGKLEVKTSSGKVITVNY